MLELKKKKDFKKVSKYSMPPSSDYPVLIKDWQRKLKKLKTQVKGSEVMVSDNKLMYQRMKKQEKTRQSLNMPGRHEAALLIH